MSKNIETKANVINFRQAAYGLSTIGNNALKLDMAPRHQADVVSIDRYRKPKKRAEAQAFRTEFYEKATDRQIEDDIISYLGEYRFEVSEHDYELDIVDDRLVDPASGEFMVTKAKRAIENRRNDGLNTSREEAELKGLITIEEERKKMGNEKRLERKTLVWFSPPGEREDGYGAYGFGYIGEEDNGKLKMTAIRLEDPEISDFNRAAQALWGKSGYKRAEDFLMSPQIVNVDKKKVKEFIQGNFEIKNEESRRIFEMVKTALGRNMDGFKAVLRNGTEQQRHTAVHVIENMALKMKKIYEQELKTGNIIYLSNHQVPNFVTAMVMREYNVAPAAVRGSCGITSKTQTNDIFRGINTDADKTPTSNSRDFEFDQSGPCRLCERDVPCGPCKICEACNDKIDADEQLATAA